MSRASLTYLYGLTRATAALPDEPGIGERPLRMLRLGNVGAVVSDVPAAEFAEEALRGHLEDLAWLERVARRHDAVVQACHRAGVAMPLRLATIYVDDRSAEQRLGDIAEEAEQTLDRLDGCDEWGVKVFESSGGARAPVPADTDAPTSGAEYLRRRQAEMMRSGDAAAAAAAEAESVYRALAQHAVDDVKHRPQDPRLAGRREAMLLNAAFLVRRTDAHAFRAAAAELAAQRRDDSIVLTGPWAPYSFAGTAV
ncbi:MAG TPA: GvpL/GvpF family gas vesicle protein [Jatrophihabitans sp.]|nr:GvpL/GvpF family gas vesicle protein [Jatrophihabitans sp.]